METKIKTTLLFKRCMKDKRSAGFTLMGIYLIRLERQGVRKWEERTEANLTEVYKANGSVPRRQTLINFRIIYFTNSWDILNKTC